MSMKIENARIESTRLGVEDHGIFTAYIQLSGDGWGCLFGGYAFDAPKKDANGKFVGRKGCAFGTEWIKELLNTLDVEIWEKLPGTLVRVQCEDSVSSPKIIGHCIKNQWFDSEQILKDYKAAA